MEMSSSWPHFQDQRFEDADDWQSTVKEYFDIWGADRDTTDVAKSYKELLSKVKDYAWRRKLVSSAKE